MGDLDFFEVAFVVIDGDWWLVGICWVRRIEVVGVDRDLAGFDWVVFRVG